jgi:excisionase family DNA binding protein
LGCSRTKENNVSDRLAYTINEAAAASRLGRTTIYDLIKRRELPLVKVGARSLIRRRDLEAFLERKLAA